MTYQDSGFSEEDQDHQVTTCLMKTPSGSIYIQPTSELVMVVVMMVMMMVVMMVVVMVVVMMVSVVMIVMMVVVVVIKMEHTPRLPTVF